MNTIFTNKRNKRYISNKSHYFSDGGINTFTITNPNTNNNSLLDEWKVFIPQEMQKENKFDLLEFEKAGINTGTQLAGVGATLGSALAPGLGTAIGGGIGYMAGSIFGKLKSGIDFLKGNKEIREENEKRARENELVVKNMQSRMAAAQNQNSLNILSNYFAKGGSLFNDYNTGLTFVENGGTHEQNPYEGVPMGIASDGQPNLVEEGEVIYNDYVFSNRLKAPKKLLEKNLLPKSYKNKTFANIAKSISKESTERPNDPISKNGLDVGMYKLIRTQEELKQLNNMSSNKFALGGRKFPDGTPNLPRITAPNLITIATTSYKPELAGYRLPELNNDRSKDRGAWQEWLKFAPAAGNLYATISDLVGGSNKSDYSNFNTAENLINSPNTVSFNPIGTYLAYKPLDRNYYLNQYDAQAGATRRAIANLSGGNRSAQLASLMANDYNTMVGRGNLIRQAEEADLEQRMRVADFNRETNMANSQGSLQAQVANLENARFRTQAALELGRLREGIDTTASSAKSANFTNLLDSIGNVGIDYLNRRDAASATDIENKGTYDDLVRVFGKKQADEIMAERRARVSSTTSSTASDNSGKSGTEAKYGGKLRKRKRGLTY